MRTWHFTSAANWESIKTFGFLPYLIKKEELLPFFPGGVMGIWLWTHEPKGLSHAGCVIYQSAYKGTVDVVKLEVEVDEKSLLFFGAQPVRVYHQGKIENLKYHNDEEACISVKPIPASRIRLAKSFNLEKLLA